MKKNVDVIIKEINCVIRYLYNSWMKVTKQYFREKGCACIDVLPGNRTSIPTLIKPSILNTRFKYKYKILQRAIEQPCTKSQKW